MESMGGVEARVQSMWRCGRWLSRHRFRQGTRVMREMGERDIREWRLHSSTSDYILQRSVEWTDLDI
jgi:hypothetical protein